MRIHDFSCTVSLNADPEVVQTQRKENDIKTFFPSTYISVVFFYDICIYIYLFIQKWGLKNLFLWNICIALLKNPNYQHGKDIKISYKKCSDKVEGEFWSLRCI